MKQFKDAKDRLWDIDIHVAAVDRVLAHADVDLYSALDGKLIAELQTNTRKFVHILWGLCEPQAAGKQIAAEEFGAGLRGDALARAMTAFLEELVDFFPSAADRANLKAALEMLDKATSRAKQLVAGTLAENGTDERIEALVTKAIESARRNAASSLGNSPELSASNPAG